MKSIRVLIADDHQLFREGMEGLLMKIPYVSEVLHANNGEEVIARLENHPCEIVFMDIRMPLLNGIETTRLITRKNIPSKVIALTMMEDAHSVASMFRAGALGYLLKNTSFSELKDAIASALRDERYYSKDISQTLLGQLLDGKPLRSMKLKKIDLTLREKEIVGLICRGFSSKEVAEILDITPKTVETHRSNIYSKLSISNVADLAFYALENGLVSREA
jgi:DNA-binding NarL/FixJ family response regulator